MREFAKFVTGFWTSENIKKLSDDGKLLAAYLISGPHSNQAGVYRLPAGYVQGDLKWTDERVAEAFADVSRNGFANRCAATEWVVVLKALKHTPPENPNQCKHVERLLVQLPSAASIVDDVIQCVKEFAPDADISFLEPSGDPSKRVRQQREGEREGDRKGEREARPRRGFDPAKIELPAWVSRETWLSYVEVRKKKHAPMTERAIVLLMRKLNRWREVGQNPNAVLEQSVMNGWTGVFELKKQTGPGGAPLPDKQWWETHDGVTQKAAELNIERKDRDDFHPAENFTVFKAQVYVAAGEGPWMHKLNGSDQRWVDFFLEKRKVA